MTMQRPKAHYATPAKVRNFVQLARDLGLDVAGFEVSAEGTIRIIEARAAAPAPQTDFDRWKDQL